MLMLAANATAYMPFGSSSGMQGVIIRSHVVDFFPPMRCRGIRDSFPPKRCYMNSCPFSQDSRSFAETFRLDRRSVVVESVGGYSIHGGIHRGIQNTLQEYGIPIHDSLVNRVRGYHIH